MKTRIDKDEWYPVYSFGNFGEEAEVSEETMIRWERVFKEFDEVQDEIREAWNKIHQGH